MGGYDGEEEPGPRRWREPVAWLGCLLAAVMPTAVLATIAQTWDAAISPLFVPALYIGIFTLMVLIIRPWSLR